MPLHRFTKRQLAVFHGVFITQRTICLRAQQKVLKSPSSGECMATLYQVKYLHFSILNVNVLTQPSTANQI